MTGLTIDDIVQRAIVYGLTQKEVREVRGAYDRIVLAYDAICRETIGDPHGKLLSNIDYLACKSAERHLVRVIDYKHRRENTL